MMHGSMVPEISSAKRDFFVILDQFLNIYHPNNQKNQNFEKLKKKKKKKKKKNLRYFHLKHFKQK